MLAPRRMMMAAAGVSVGATIPDPNTELVHHWRADLGITVATGVSAWLDQVGSADWAQGTGSAQPLYSASDVGFNNQAILNFDAGNDQWMTCTISAVVQPLHIFMALSIVSWRDGDLILCQPSGPTIEMSGSAYDLKQEAGTASTNIVDHRAPSAFLLQSAFDGASSFQARNDGAHEDAGDPGADDYSAATFAIGALTGGPPNAANMKVAEVAIYSAFQAGADETTIEDYFNTRYSLW
tara:strand:- start:989 stop:1702 length:714 start_codon:yes stop_codon:yes gene_type:complete